VLRARLETIRQLAGGVPDRVAVVDRDGTIVYANEAARRPLRPGGAGRPPATCDDVLGCPRERCAACPSLTLFASSPVPSRAVPRRDERFPCGLLQAFPLASDRGETALVLLVLDPAPPPPVGRESLGGVLGRSPAMQQLFEMMGLVADSAATVLLQGESGTGKELVAKTIHALSARRDHPFVVVDCGALPETLLDSELFGHLKGTFTGAFANKRGLFEEAHGGTLFLDEIAETTPAFQAKLLRVVQEGELKRVGGTHPLKVDVRIISATNKDLTALVRAHAFRQDLYYRLAVLPLQLPPLRERREDIPLLVRHFVAAACHRHRQPPRLISPDVLHAWTVAPWPGNVRELQHAIERAVVTTPGPQLTGPELGTRDADPGDRDLRSVSRRAVTHAEEARIRQALHQAEGNRVQTAKLLNISRASLYNKLHQYQIT
jgi:two-component system response regulator AtoC